MNDIYELAKEYSHIVSQLPGYFLFKSCDSQYFGFSEKFSQLLGWKNQKECVGLLDADLKCQASEMSKIFIKEDQDTLLHGETKQLHLTRYCDDNARIFITNKRRLVSKDNQVVGLIVYDEDVTHNFCIQKILLNERAKISKQASKKSFVSVKMKISSSYPGFDLSVRESEILFYLIRSESAKSISSLLNIASRTVEKHTQNIMEKLGCFSRKQLIEFSEHKQIAHILLNNIFTRSMRLEL